MSRAQQDTYFSDEDEDYDCPLCMEEMDLSDRNFRPCACGYQICRFCWHHIKENLNGRCPACRRLYSEQDVDFKPISSAELTRLKNEKKQKEREKRELEAANRKHLANMRVVQKNLVYVIGLSPKVANEELLQTLRSNDYFGQYGKIHKIVINKRSPPPPSGAPGAAPPQASVGVYITYYRKDDAARAIDAVDGSISDGRILRASYGTTKYCSYYLRGMACQNPGCMYLHEPGEEADSFTKEDLATFKHGLKDNETNNRQIHGRPNAPAYPFKKPLPGDTRPTIGPQQSCNTADNNDGEGSALPRTASWATKPSSRPATPIQSASPRDSPKLQERDHPPPKVKAASKVTSASSASLRQEAPFTKEESPVEPSRPSNVTTNLPPVSRPTSAASPIYEFEQTLSAFGKGSFEFSLALPEEDDESKRKSFSMLQEDNQRSQTSTPSTPTLYSGSFNPFAIDSDANTTAPRQSKQWPSGEAQAWPPVPAPLAGASAAPSLGRPGSRFGFAQDTTRSPPVRHSSQDFQEGFRALLPGVNVSFANPRKDAWSGPAPMRSLSGDIYQRGAGKTLTPPPPPGIFASSTPPVNGVGAGASTNGVDSNWSAPPPQSRFMNRSSAFNAAAPSVNTAPQATIPPPGVLPTPPAQGNAQEFFGQFLKAAAAQSGTRPSLPSTPTYENLPFQDPAIMSMRMPLRPAKEAEILDRPQQSRRLGSFGKQQQEEEPSQQQAPPQPQPQPSQASAESVEMSRESSTTSIATSVETVSKKKRVRKNRGKDGEAETEAATVANSVAKLSVTPKDNSLPPLSHTSETASLRPILLQAVQELYDEGDHSEPIADAFIFFRSLTKSKLDECVDPSTQLEVPLPCASVEELEKALGSSRKDQEALEARLQKLIKRNKKQVFA